MSVQPRVRLLRSFDQRSDTCLGYVARLAGSVDGEPRSFAIAIGEAALQAGPTRKVPGRQGMTWEEEDWVDHDAVAHRDADD